MTQPENQAEALDEKALAAAAKAIAIEANKDDLPEGGWLEYNKQCAEAAIRAYLAALPEAVDICASEGCGNPAAVHFIRGDVGSYYCKDCYRRIHAMETERLAALASQNAVEGEAVATLLPCDPYDERGGPWFLQADLKRLASLPAGTKLYAGAKP